MGQGRWVMTLVATGALGLAGNVPSAGAQSSEPDPSAFAFDGSVTAVVPAGDVTYVAGDFGAQLPRVAGSAVVAAPDGVGTLRSGLPVVDGPITAAVGDGAGGVYVGGEFQHVGTRSIINLAHIRADGSVDPDVDGRNAGNLPGITRLDVDRNRLVVGSSLPDVAGTTLDVLTLAAVPVRRITSVDAIQGWDAAGGLIHIARQVAREDGTAGAELVTVDPEPPDFAPDAPVGPPADLGPVDELVASVAVSGATVVVAGERRAYDITSGESRATPFAAGFDLATLAPRWASPPAPGAPIDGSARYVLEPAGGRVYLARTQGAAPGSELLALDPATGGEVWRADDELGPAFGAVAGLLVRAGTVYAAGAFETVMGGPDRLGAAAFDATTGALRAWDPTIGRPGAAAIAPFGDGVLLAGAFAAAGQPVGRVHDLARLRADGSLDASFAPVVLDPGERDAAITGLDLDGSTLYLAGSFGRVGTAVRDGAAAVDVATGALTPFTVPAGALEGASGPETPVNIAASAGKVVVSSPSDIAVFGADGTPDDWDLSGALGDDPAGRYFDAFTRSGSRLYFTGSGRPVINGFDLATEQPLAVPVAQELPGSPRFGDPTVFFGNGRTYLHGSFDLVGGAPRRGLAEVDPGTGAATAFDAGANDAVTGAAATAGKVFAAGFFTRLGGERRAGAGAVDAVTGAATPWQPTVDPRGFSKLAAGEDRVIVFGYAFIGGPPGSPFVEPYRQFTIPKAGAGATGAALRRLLDDLDLAAAGGVNGHVDVPAAGRVRVSARVGSYVVASGAATASAAGPLEVPLTVNDAGRLILSVYPDFAFDGRARFVPADGGDITAVLAPVQRPAGG